MIVIDAWVSRDTDGTFKVFAGDHPVNFNRSSKEVEWVSKGIGDEIEALSVFDDSFPHVKPGKCRRAKLTLSLRRKSS